MKARVFGGGGVWECRGVGWGDGLFVSLKYVFMLNCDGFVDSL